MTEHNEETILSGSVENVVFSNPVNHFTVIEMNAAGGEIITAVGVLPEIAAGWSLRPVRPEDRALIIGKRDFTAEASPA